MLLAYNLMIEPQGLKALAYRHCNAHQDDYQDVMGEAGRDKAIEYLSQVMGYTWPDIEPILVTEGGKTRVKKPWNIEKRVAKIIIDVLNDKRDKEGNPTDPRKRWKEIDDYVRDPVEMQLGPMPNATLDDIDPAKATRYAIRDADITLRIGPILEQKIKDMGLEKISRIDHNTLPMLDSMQENGIRLAPPPFWDAIEVKCETQMNKAVWEIFKATGEEINPASGDQVADLLYGKLGLTPPKLTDSGERGSVNGLCLETLLSENPVVQHVMDYTEARKIVGTYVIPLRRLCMRGDRVHSTIRATRTTTGRLAMADPPLHQIPILSDIGRELRGGFIPEEGNVMGDWDVDQLEARVCAHDSKDPELCRLFNEGRDVHAETACRMFSVSMSALSRNPETGKVNDYRRSVAKHCIAEGQLVLTDQGLVPIEKITLQHRLWDGVEWVTHDGIIDQGIREVIEYDGLTATPDHEVFTANGRSALLWEAASSMERLETTGDGRQEIRTSYRDLLERTAQKRIHRAESEMHEMPQSMVDHKVKSDQTRFSRVQIVQHDKIRNGISQQISGEIRCNLSTLQQSKISELQGLWGAGYKVSIPVKERIRILDGEESASQRLSGHHNRSNRQRWQLRAGKFTLGQPATAESKSPQYSSSNVQRPVDQHSRFRQPLWSPSDMELHSKRLDWRAHYSTCCRGRCVKGSTEGMARKIKVARFARVFDILNAGPRLCFTVSNKLVWNCFFGIINGITEKGLVNYMITNRCRKLDGSTWTEDDCVLMLHEWFEIYKGVKKFHLDCIAETQATGLARESIGGRLIYLPQIWSPNKVVRESAERMSYVIYTQGGGQTIIKKAMKVVWDEVCKKKEFGAMALLQMHDELLFELPDNEDIKKDVDRIVVGALTETTKLRVPMRASGGYGMSWLAAH